MTSNVKYYYGVIDDFHLMFFQYIPIYCYMYLHYRPDTHILATYVRLRTSVQYKIFRKYVRKDKRRRKRRRKTIKQNHNLKNHTLKVMK